LKFIADLSPIFEFIADLSPIYRRFIATFIAVFSIYHRFIATF
jgi:hypothetical protein